MRAARIHQCGEPPRVGEVEAPTPGPGQALVAVTAAPITPLDLLCASGTSYFGEPATPYVPGVQGVGVVRSSELAVVPDADLVPVSGALPDAQLAALGLSAIGAWTALSWRGALRAGERVLVLGSSGVVGTVAVQAARLQGAGAVYAAAIEPGAGDAARALGADGFVPLGHDDDAEALAGRMREVVGEVDLVLDPLCGVPSSAAALCLAPRGRLVNLGGSAGPTASYSSAHLRSGSREVRGYTNNDLTAEQRYDALQQIEIHAEAGRLTAPYEVFGLDEVASAWTRQLRGEVAGRAVVAFS
ncbi:zinc-binding dehydrogenase [Nocardioides pyridinolyticus]